MLRLPSRRRVAHLHDAGQLLRALPAVVPAESRERITALLAASGLNHL